MPLKNKLICMSIFFAGSAQAIDYKYSDDEVKEACVVAVTSHLSRPLKKTDVLKFDAQTVTVTKLESCVGIICDNSGYACMVKGNVFIQKSSGYLSAQMKLLAVVMNAAGEKKKVTDLSIFPKSNDRPELK